MIARASLVALSLCMLLVGRAAADDYPEVVFILDSSGSMAEEVAGQEKMAAAKEVMHKVVPELDENIHVGLTAYGHRRPGDCTDIEVLIPAGSDDRDALLSYVDRLQPVGRTPISSAILSVASEIRLKDVETTIVLVSDGLETCNGDPCQVAAQLKQTGCNFVLHVVGFAVSPEAAAQLECTAQAGGGRYFSANDTESLLEALRMVNAEVKQKVEKAETQLKTDSTGLGKLRLRIPGGAEESVQFVRLVDADTGKEIMLKENPGDDFVTPLKSGEYQVFLGFAQPNHAEPTLAEVGTVTIRKGETRELPLGAVVLNLPESLVNNDWNQRINLEAVTIADAGTNEPFAVVYDNKNGYFNFKSKPVPAGLYNVLFTYRTAGATPTLVAQDVLVEPGREAVVTLDSAVQVRETETPINGWRLIRKTPSQAGEEAEGLTAEEEVALQTGASGAVSGGRQSLWYPYIVPPGTYDLVVDVEGMTEPMVVGEAIEIAPGDHLKFDTGF